MAIIELGDVSAPDFVDEPAPPPRPVTRHTLTRLVTAALALLSAAGLAGSGRPAPPALAETWSAQIGMDSYPFPFRDTVLVNYGTPQDGSDMTAYDLRTGKVLWAAGTGTGMLSGWLNPDQESNQLYAADHTRTVTTSDGAMVFGTDTRAVDGSTGATLWHRSGDELAATAGEVLLGDRDEQGRVTGLRLVRAGDGTTIWDRAIPATGTLTVSDDPAGSARIVYGTATGELTVLRYSDGVPLATRRFPRPAAGLNWGLQPLNGQLYDIRNLADGTTVTAYRTDTLTELWSFDTTGGGVYVQDCAPLLCVSDMSLASGIDPATGERRWQLPGSDITSIGGGRLLVGPGNDSTGRSVVDAATTRVINKSPDDSTILALDDGTLLALRNTGGAPYRVAISRWDPVSGRVSLLGAVPGRADSCQVTGRRLLCQGAGRLGVTDLRTSLS